MGDNTILKGTAIATFVDGKYGNLPTGNHAALYISQDASGYGLWINGSVIKANLKFQNAT